MSELLSIQPQLIEDRVLKQMYDDIAGMYNILTNKPDISLAARIPEVCLREGGKRVSREGNAFGGRETRLEGGKRV